MKKLLFLLVVIAAVFIVYNRQRLFLRDPLGSVVRNGVKEEGAQVFINFNSDVMIENDNAPLYVEVIAANDHTGAPQNIKCIQYVACLMDADLPTLLPWPTGITVHSMTTRAVRFLEGKRETTVTLY